VKTPNPTPHLPASWWDIYIRRETPTTSPYNPYWPFDPGTPIYIFLPYLGPPCDSAQFPYLGVASRRNIEHTEGRKKGKEACTRSLQLLYGAPAPRRCLIGKPWGRRESPSLGLRASARDRVAPVQDTEQQVRTAVTPQRTTWPREAVHRHLRFPTGPVSHQLSKKSRKLSESPNKIRCMRSHILCSNTVD